MRSGKIQKFEYLENGTKNKKILNLCLRRHISRNYRFAAEVTLTIKNITQIKLEKQIETCLIMKKNSSEHRSFWTDSYSNKSDLIFQPSHGSHTC